jgi:hypothetical protein
VLLALWHPGLSSACWLMAILSAELFVILVTAKQLLIDACSAHIKPPGMPGKIAHKD